MVYGSTGLRNALLPYMREMFNRGCATLKLFSGTIPASADAAETGTLINTITAAGAAVKAKQKIRFTPVTAGTTGTWSITLNGVTYTFTDDASPTVAEVCTGLYRLIRAGIGDISITTTADGAITAGGKVTIPEVNSLFTLTDNATSLDIEADTAGISFDYSATATGAGNSITVTIITADAYGLQFEAIADISAGIIEKLASQEWKGTNIASGSVTHWRLVLDGDTGTLSTSEKRLQGQLNTAGSDMNRTSGVQFVEDDIEYVSTFPVTFPASA